jgi:hypothetical protein
LPGFSSLWEKSWLKIFLKQLWISLSGGFDEGNRIGRLRAYGNALCAPQAEAFIRAYFG